MVVAMELNYPFCNDCFSAIGYLYISKSEIANDRVSLLVNVVILYSTRCCQLRKIKGLIERRLTTDDLAVVAAGWSWRERGGRTLAVVQLKFVGWL